MSASPTPSRFSLNPEARLAVHHVGDEHEPVIVVDGALIDPTALVDHAVTGAMFTATGVGGYPGVRAPAPLDYVETLVRRLDPVVRLNFGLDDVVLARAECSFSIVTTPPHSLAPVQRLPHIDTSYPLQFAILHFLCDGDFGGTGFFRHLATGFEKILVGRKADYEATIARQLKTALPPSGYLGRDLPYHQMTAAFEAVFDRVLVYRSCLLHCGLIPPDMPLIANPAKGRLTANIFVNYAQKIGHRDGVAMPHSSPPHLEGKAD